MSLDQEIEDRRAEVRTDGYSMSIGELINMYRDRDLEIHPEFQRFFRWSPEQKSRLIESILLGIPIPSIFVSTREDGVWDVIDGLQRLSTIFQLVGELRDANDQKLDPLVLTQTKYLPSLVGKTWEDDGSGSSIGETNQRLIRRAKIDVKIIERESTESTKFELFQRLNTGGSNLSDQEIRNAILVMVNPPVYRWIADLAGEPDFQTCIPITERDQETQYDLELATRFIIFRRLEEEGLHSVRDVGDFLTDNIVEFAQSGNFQQAMDKETEAFRFTFGRLATALGDNSFRKYDLTREAYFGGFSLSVFEPISMGLGYHFEAYNNAPSNLLPDIRKISKDLWKSPVFTNNSGSGVRASQRVRTNIPLGRRMFKP
jgi:hypothetical protein